MKTLIQAVAIKVFRDLDTEEFHDLCVKYGNVRIDDQEIRFGYESEACIKQIVERSFIGVWAPGRSDWIRCENSMSAEYNIAALTDAINHHRYLGNPAKPMPCFIRHMLNIKLGE